MTHNINKLKTWFSLFLIFTFSLSNAQGKWLKLFDGKTFNGWRGYNKAEMPKAWSIEKKVIKIDSSASQTGGGGTIIFDRKFRNFELEIEWKVTKGGNSGIFYLAQEVIDCPIHYSSPEYQVLDNENHGDAKEGFDGNRKSASLYDMIPAKPQNAKSYGKWNKAKIEVLNGTVTHYQNGALVVKYELWTPDWVVLLNKSKFAESKNPVAFKLLSNCGGENKEGVIGLQDHGDEVWFRKIRIRELN